jgi:outer membrane protein OmpA-like peptidoglycan-associated protein
VEYSGASEDEIYDTLVAPPVEPLRRNYSLDQVKYTQHLRQYMRRIDLDEINFEFGSWELDQAAYQSLERVAHAMERVITRKPNEIFLIEGHTDAVGSEEDNLTLSDRRAEAVAVALTETFGLASENLTTQGYGEQYLKLNTEQPERINRRVAIRRITPLISQKD